MSKNNSLADLGDGTAVSSNSPQSPITLDFDPMSFQFKEDSPLTSPSDNSHELIDDICSSNSANVDFFDPFCPVKEESPTDYYPNVMLGELGSHEPLARDDEVSKHELCDEPLVDVHVSEACDSASTVITTTTTIITTKVCQETLESSHSGLVDSADEDSLGGGEFQCEPDESDSAQTREACVYEADTSVVDEPLIKVDDSQHVTDQDEVFQHDESQFSTNDLSRRGKVSSVSSSNSSRSERSERRTMRKTSSTSSESSMREEEVKSSKMSSTVKVTKTEEVSAQKKEVTQERKISTAEKTPKTEIIVNGVDKTLKDDKNNTERDKQSIAPEGRDEHEGRESPECPVSVAELDDKNNTGHDKHSIASDGSDEHEGRELPECPVSVAAVDDKLSTASEGRDEPEGRESPECPVSVAELRSSYVHQVEQEPLSSSPSKEVIATGIDIQSLKSTLIKSEEESHQSSLQEEVKPSIDRAKVQRTFSQEKDDDDGNESLGFCIECMNRYLLGTGQSSDVYYIHPSTSTSGESSICKMCNKGAYPMEKVTLGKSVYHKSCFRCSECGKSLTLETYNSHEGDVYCKPHFRLLTEPKARFDEEDSAPPAASQLDYSDSDTGKQRRNELIIRENVPAELPPDVVRSDTKPDHGLESLPVNLSNLKSKFEAYREEHHLPSTTDVCTLQRSASVMARLAKYQSAVSGENENGDISDSESEGEELEDPSVVKPTKHKEKVVFSGMSNLKNQWETGSVVSAKEEKIEEKKEELNKLRQRMCLGRSESMKAVYEKACQDSSKVTPTRTESVVLGRDIKAVRIKEKFEKGELVSEVEEEKLERLRKEKEEDLGVFTEPSIANDAKKLFQQIDATVKTTAMTPTSPNKSPMNERKKSKDVLYSSQSSMNEAHIIKCSEPTAKEEIPVDTTDVSQRFKFFENYTEAPKERKRFQITPPREVIKEDTPEKEIVHDPNIVRAIDNVKEVPITDTTRKMLDKFKQLEKETPSPPSGPKPLKRITPPREYTKEDEHDSSPEPERDPNIIRSSYKVEDDVIVEADKAKSLRAKFENWDIEQRENRKNEDDMEEECLPQVDTTKTLRAKFEAIKEDTLKPIEKPKAKVNRFI